jgi:hypothetical protein
MFLDLAREWRATADTLRQSGLPRDHPALWVWREAAWCQLLFARGHYPAAVNRLRAVVQEMTGAPPPDPNSPMAGEAVALSAASDLFDRLRAAVVARHPTAFGRPAA